MLKLIHCADLHLDSPFRNEKAAVSARRRKELRETFEKLIKTVKEMRVDICLMAGDMFDAEYVTRDTAAYFAGKLGEAPGCRFVISPGNHDPFTEKGVYGQTGFPDNVYIFRSGTPSKFSFPEIETEVYGYAFTESTLGSFPFENTVPDDPGMINVLCGHGDAGVSESKYCPIPESSIAASGFDYFALGHIHNSAGMKKAGNTFYAYSGCVEGRDFGEIGRKGVLYVEIAKNGGLVVLKHRELPLSKRRYEEVCADITGMESPNDVYYALRKVLRDGGYGEDTLLRVSLVGDVPPELKTDTEALRIQLEPNVYSLEIIDRTSPVFNEEKLMNDVTLRGAFFRELLSMLHSESEEERTAASKALRIGLAAIAGEDFEDRM